MIPRTYLLPTLKKIGPPSFRRFMVNLLPYKALHDLRDVADVLYQTSSDIYHSKKASLESDELDGVSRGRDIMTVLSG